MGSEILTKWAVALEIPAEETDLNENAHVGDGVMLGWFARARAAYLEQCPSLADGSLEPTVKTVEMKHRRPVEHPDTVLVATSVTELGETWFAMACRVRSLLGSHGVVAHGRCTMVVIDPRTGEPVPVPEPLRRDFFALEMGARFHS
ncbi:MAG: thioesterase family protein [Actinomycetota bacterium]